MGDYQRYVCKRCGARTIVKGGHVCPKHRSIGDNVVPSDEYEG